MFYKLGPCFVWLNLDIADAACESVTFRWISSQVTQWRIQRIEDEDEEERPVREQCQDHGFVKTQETERAKEEEAEEENRNQEKAVTWTTSDEDGLVRQDVETKTVV